MNHASAFRHQQMFAHAAYQTASQSQQSPSDASVKPSGQSESSSARNKENAPQETNVQSLPLAPLDAKATPKNA